MIVVRRAAPEDLEAIAAIQRGSGEASQWAAEAYFAYQVRVAKCDGRVVGFLATREVAPGEGEILNLAVSPEFRRRGVARALLGEAMREDPNTYYLEVRESNHPARRLYRGLGFEEVGMRRNYYSEPAEDAVVMRIYSCYCHSAVGRR